MVFDEVKKIIADQVKVDVSSIEETTTFHDIDADSLDVVEVIMAVEEHYSIKLSDEKVETLKSVGEFAKYVEDLCQ